MPEIKLDPQSIAAAADRLTAAAATGNPCEPVRDLIGREDVAAAYAVQHRNEAMACRAGRKVVGRKIGLTSLSVQQQLGVDQPDFGSLYADRGYVSGAVVDLAHYLQPRAEAEVALKLRHDIPGTISEADLPDAVEWIAPAIEIADSRIMNWDITLADTIADNASYGGHVIGPFYTDWRGLDLPKLQMTMTLNGRVISQGRGRDCMGSPLKAAAWLARYVSDIGLPLRAGEIVLTGALGPMAPIRTGDKLHAVFADLGEVACQFH
ncbi:MAG: fumarylacetoacetate hydrolase family protein [Pseudomonadota bacterium]|nr:fumarylacetoacetate hydrolase family protein [Pseudomonadota bacterium]